MFEEKKTPIEFFFDAAGITGENWHGNLLLYSYLAAAHIDQGALAASRYDTDAARLLRMAAEGMKWRADRLLQESLYGPSRVPEGKKKEIWFKMSPWPINLANWYGVTSVDTFENWDVDQIDDALDNIDEVQGALIRNLLGIIKTEKSLSELPVYRLAIVVNGSQENLVERMQMNAKNIADMIYEAVCIISRKFAGSAGDWLCTTCFTRYTGLPEKCDICESAINSFIAVP